jgi:hypothetical protein
MGLSSQTPIGPELVCQVKGLPTMCDIPADLLEKMPNHVPKPL